MVVEGRTSSDREANAAAAAGGGVRVPDHELGAGQFIDEVDFRALQQRHRHDIDQGRSAIALDLHAHLRELHPRRIQKQAEAGKEEKHRKEKGIKFIG